MKQHIYLIGFMGTGKTTISHKLRELTGAEEMDRREKCLVYQ